jgi:hypothetical protein
MSGNTKNNPSRLIEALPLLGIVVALLIILPPGAVSSLVPPSESTGQPYSHHETDVIPTDQWVDFYSLNTTVDGEPVPIGAVVAAFDPDGIQCGEFIVTNAGWYGVMPVYGDDPETAEDEGAEPGDTIAFTINGHPATPMGPDEPVWTINGDLRQVDLAVTSTSTPTSTPTATATPTSTGALTSTPTRTRTPTPTLPPHGHQVYLPLILKNYSPGPPPTNNPPYTPSNPSPSDGATNQSMNTNLSWTGGDPDGDTVTYDVYFEANDSIPDVLVSDDQSGTTYDPGTLSAGTHFYWQVVARDEHGVTTTAPVWDFTTQGAFTVWYVAPGGDCGGAMPCYATVQAAVDAASTGDEIRVAAGTYTGVGARAGVTQMVYISKTVTIRGGYSTSNWTTPDPTANLTTLDAQGQGRVLYITGDISPTVEGLGITGGDAAGLGGHSWGDTGGGVYIVNSTASISDCWVFGNTAEYGGGLYLGSDSAATLSASSVYANTANGGYGGGLWLCGSNATLSKNTVYSNTAALGGGLDLHFSSATLSENSICYNTATGDGGGVNLHQSDDATLDRNTVCSNTAAVFGGGIDFCLSAATLNGNIVRSNTAFRGGGLYLSSSNAMLTNNLVADNRASYQGSGLYVLDSSPSLLHTTIASNSGGDGSGVYVTDWLGAYSSIALINTIVVGHNVGAYVTSGNTATLEATLWYDNGVDRSGAGTINHTNDQQGDPSFVDPDAGDYHIGPGSAARDVGVDAGGMIDIDGQTRPQGTGFDIGADEYAPAARPMSHPIPHLPMAPPISPQG